jgi:hypothetical protein
MLINFKSVSCFLTPGKRTAYVKTIRSLFLSTMLVNGLMYCNLIFAVDWLPFFLPIHVQDVTEKK